MVDETFDYVNYLDVKKSIDDKSLNQAVWDSFARCLLAQNKLKRSLKIMEIGAGIGTMIERLLDASLLKQCHYIALEPEAPFKEAAKARLISWADSKGMTFAINTEGLWLLGNNQSDNNEDLHVTIEWIEAEADKIAELFEDESLDFILSHAVIDLLPVPVLMPVILSKLKQQGGFYFSINFSGQTCFSPGHKDDHDIADSYHQDMDARFPGMDWQPSMTGEALPEWLENYGCRKVIKGGSDWSLSAINLDSRDALFIKNILDTIAKALKAKPGLDGWLAERYGQLEQKKLEIKISNCDCFGLK